MGRGTGREERIFVLDKRTKPRPRGNLAIYRTRLAFRIDANFLHLSRNSPLERFAVQRSPRYDPSLSFNFLSFSSHPPDHLIMNPSVSSATRCFTSCSLIDRLAFIIHRVSTVALPRGIPSLDAVGFLRIAYVQHTRAHPSAGVTLQCNADWLEAKFHRKVTTVMNNR